MKKKTFLKAISALLAAVMIVLLVPPVEIEAYEHPTYADVVSVSVDDMTIVEGTRGNWCLGSDENGNETTWWVYEAYPDSYTVTFSDGSEQTLETWDYVVDYRTGGYYCLGWSYDQSYDNQWGVGTHTATAMIAGVETTYTVEIVENPIESISIPDTTIIENTNGYWEYSWDEYGNTIKWWCYSFSPAYYTVNFKDGTSRTLENWEGIDIYGQHCGLSVQDDQWSNHWGLGTHTGTASLCGVETTFNVEIIESPIESIQVDDVSIIEGTSGNLSYHYGYDENGEYFVGRYWNYIYSNDLKYTVTFRDGTTQTLSRWENIEIGGESYSLSIWDDQSYDNQWGVGTHTATASLFGVETTFGVEIKKSPVKEVVVKDSSAIVETHGSYYSGNGDSRFEYGLMNLEYTVTFEDGSVVTTKSYVEYDGVEYTLVVLDDQSDYNRWGIGEHTVKASLGGVETEFVYEILESPVAGVVFKDIELYENFDGYYSSRYDSAGEYVPYFHYDYNPEYTLLLKDGTVIKSVGGFVEYNGEAYDVYCANDQSENPWGLGTHKIEAKVLGYAAEFDVNVVECPYTAIEISGEKELYLTLYKNDGTSETTKALGYGSGYYDGGKSVMYTEMRDMCVGKKCCFSGDPLIDFKYEGLRLEIGNLVSNTLYGNEWCEAMMMANEYQSNINSAFGSDYEGFNGTVTSENLNDIIYLASRMYFDYDNYLDVVVVEGVYFFYVKLDFVKECISKVFGITDIDLTASDWYDPSRPDYIRIPEPMGWGAPHKMSLNYENGFWVYESNSVWLSYKNLKVYMDEELHIKRIEFDGRCGTFKGDVNGDGNLNVRDLFLLKNALIKGDEMTEEEIAVMDLDESGTVNISDLFMLKSILIG